MAQRCVDALISQAGTPRDRHSVLRSFRTVVAAAGLNAKDRAPRELRHSFVSLLSDDGVPLEIRLATEVRPNACRQEPLGFLLAALGVQLLLTGLSDVGMVHLTTGH